MAAGKLIVKGIPGYDGEYEIPNSYTNGELHRIKQISGIPAGLLGDAFQDGDVGAVVAVTAVLLERAGHQVNVQELWDASVVDNWEFTEPSEEGEGRPPDSATTGGDKNADVASVEPNEPTEPSGTDGTSSGGSSQDDQRTTGSPSSETSELDPAISPV